MIPLPTKKILSIVQHEHTRDDDAEHDVHQIVSLVFRLGKNKQSIPKKENGDQEHRSRTLVPLNELELQFSQLTDQSKSRKYASTHVAYFALLRFGDSTQVHIDLQVAEVDVAEGRNQ